MSREIPCGRSFIVKTSPGLRFLIHFSIKSRCMSFRKNIYFFLPPYCTTQPLNSSTCHSPILSTSPFIYRGLLLTVNQLVAGSNPATRAKQSKTAPRSRRDFCLPRPLTFNHCSSARIANWQWLGASVAMYTASSLSSPACLIISSQLGYAFFAFTRSYRSFSFSGSSSAHATTSTFG